VHCACADGTPAFPYTQSEVARRSRSDMSVDVVNIDIVSDVVDSLLSARFRCDKLGVGDKSFTNDMDNVLAGTRGGANANVGVGSGDGPLPTTWARNSGRERESPRLEDSGDICEPSGRVMITL
jgi:hypothetical protein